MNYGSTDPNNFTMMTANHVTKEIIHVMNVSNMKNMLTPILEEEATINVCIACKQWHVVAVLKPIAKKVNYMSIKVCGFKS